MDGYNGWTNWETWLVNLWFGDALTMIHQKSPFEDQVALRDYTVEMVADYGQMPQTGFASDAIGGVLGAVNWYELYQHYSDNS